MVRNISYHTRELKEEIDLEVGRPFSIIERIKMGGNGSQRFVIVEASKEIELLYNRDNKTNFCNIELREKGIILRFRSVQETFAWIIPYHLMSIFKDGNHISIFAGSEFVRLTPAHNSMLDNKFFRKLQDGKSNIQKRTKFYI